MGLSNALSSHPRAILGGLLLIAFALEVLQPLVVDADVVVLKDGRRYEGTIVAESTRAVVIYTKFDSVRTAATFKMDDVKSVERKALPDGFFGEEPADARARGAKAHAAGQTLYLEVPVVGEFGTDVFSGGFRKIFTYARRHGIGHIVFTIDSTGGNLDEALEIYRIFKRYRGSVKLHAVVKNCLGDPLSVALWCDTILLQPGARIGGMNRKVTDVSKKLAGEEEEIIRAQIAEDVVADMRREGAADDVVRAMLDPAQTLAVWKTEAGKFLSDFAAPEGMPKEEVLLSVGEGEVLQISHDQAKAMGLPTLSGGAADLGKALGLEGWTLESGYGKSMMDRATAAAKKRAAAAAAKFERAVERNVSRRETTDRSISHNLQKAAEWDPSDADYGTYGSRWGWGWGGGWGGVAFTKASQRRWRNRTDASVHYLKRARRAATSMKKLDAEAVKLGLEPTYEDGVLIQMIDDFKVRMKNLVADRNKRGR
ncbi:MAG: hypothetical protein O7H41_13240 [Planctomycetota bacterium]|nr:hypothetical protein [Planctomycetota bacterium]